MCRTPTKRTLLIELSFATALLFFSAGIANAGSPAADDAEWFRIKSPNDEFSIEVPRKHNYVYDREGFFVSRDTLSIALTDMNMLNAYMEDTLLSFEIYRSKKVGLEAIFENDKRSSWGDLTNIDLDGVRIRQVVLKKDNHYWVRQYFSSNSHIYVLTAASRKGETPAIKRFLGSLTMKPSETESDNGRFPSLTDGKVSVRSIEPGAEKRTRTDRDGDGAGVSRLILINRQPASYTDMGKTARIQGTIELLLTFGSDAFISDIVVVTPLPHGLVRQAIFTALRLKFLPHEENGKPVSVVRPFDFRFSFN